MADIELEHDREGVHYRLADRVDIVALLAIERDVYNGDIPWTFSHFVT
jgi:[SSU ribosomal protein S18P]-alanine acetyltransferase (EC 2.3.1.128)